MVYTQQKRGVIAPNIMVLIALGVLLLGGAMVGIFKLIQQDGGAECSGGDCGAATSTAPFPEPDWAPRTQCGDNVCNPNEKANPNACPQDCTVATDVPPPTITSFTATPATVTSGGTTMLSWSSTSTFCASAGDESSWFVTGGSPNGSVNSKSLYSTRTFTLSCMAEDGETITKSITVNVAAAAPTKTPTITMSASPESIGKGKTSTITWSTTNATKCVASGGGTSSGWSGTRATKGSFTTPALTTRQTYVLVCSGNGRSASRSVSVAVAEGPQVTFTATPEEATSGEAVTLAWLASSATSCTASGDGADWGWSGTLPASGVQTTPALKESQMYTITCDNNLGGSTTVNAQVVVTVPKLSLSLTPSSQSVSYGKQASLKWTSSGATSCTGSGSWSDSTFGLSDTKLTKALTASEVLEVTCTGEGGTITQKATVTVSDASKCSLGGTSVSHGSSVTAYQSSSVSYGSSCVSETRTCSNGTFTSGSYTNASCTVGEASGCTTSPWGSVKDGYSATAYSASTAPAGKTCASISTTSRSCSNGTVTGDNNYAYGTCTENTISVPSITLTATATGKTTATLSATISANNADTSYTWYLSESGTYSPNRAPTVYKTGTVTASNQTGTTSWNAVSLTGGTTYYVKISATNSNGTTNKETTFTTDAYASCTTPWGTTVSSGSSVTAYLSESITSSSSDYASCTSESRSCADGTLSGTYSYATCALKESRQLCVDHYLYLKVDYDGLNAKLKWVDTNGSNVQHHNCGDETSYANTDSKDTDGWHIYKQVTIPSGKTSVNFCANSACTIGGSVNVGTWGSSGAQSPTLEWTWATQ